MTIVFDEDDASSDWMKSGWDLTVDGKIVSSVDELVVWLERQHMSRRQFRALQVYSQSLWSQPWLADL